MSRGRMLLLWESEGKAAAALYRRRVRPVNRADLMPRMRQMHGRKGFAAVYASLVIFRDDQCMFRSHTFDRALVIADLFRAITGIVATAMGAPLILSAYYFGKILLYYPTAPVVLGASYMVGLPVSSLAALINAIILSLLARFRLDALPVALAFGAIIGVLARTHVLQSRVVAAMETSTTSLQELLPFGTAGVLMGGLYWLIAILPVRRRRLTQVSVEARDRDRAAQGAANRTRDRRIPWDGRVPPH